jgi:hypothetical protein
VGAQIGTETLVKVSETLTQVSYLIQWQAPTGRLRDQFGFKFILSSIPQFAFSDECDIVKVITRKFALTVASGHLIIAHDSWPGRITRLVYE